MRHRISGTRGEVLVTHEPQVVAFIVAVPYIWHTGRGRYHTPQDDLHYGVLFEVCEEAPAIAATLAGR